MNEWIKEQKVVAFVLFHLSLPSLSSLSSPDFSHLQVLTRVCRELRLAVLNNEYFFRKLCDHKWRQDEGILRNPSTPMCAWWIPLLDLLKNFARGDTKEGLGVFRWSERRYYIGKWVDNVRDGIGIYVFGDGRVYHGEWEKGKRNGLGMMWWGYKHQPSTRPRPVLSHHPPLTPLPSLSPTLLASSKFPPPPLPLIFPPIHGRQENKKHHDKWGKYNGMWRNNRRSVFGSVVYASGRSYRGYWKLGKYNGTGTLLSAEGHVLYEGEWYQGARDSWED